jgi:hypothetical protein
VKLSEFPRDVRDAAYQQWGQLFQERVNSGHSFDEARAFTGESVLDLKLRGREWLDGWSKELARRAAVEKEETS